jgi:hypothetical protein
MVGVLMQVVLGASATASDELQEEEVWTHEPAAPEEEAQIEDARKGRNGKRERWCIRLRVAIRDA